MNVLALSVAVLVSSLILCAYKLIKKPLPKMEAGGRLLVTIVVLAAGVLSYELAKPSAPTHTTAVAPLKAAPTVKEKEGATEAESSAWKAERAQIRREDAVFAQREKAHAREQLSALRAQVKTLDSEAEQLWSEGKVEQHTTKMAEVSATEQTLSETRSEAE